jgi:hypothetical protein
VLRLWVSYTPTSGKDRKHGFYGLRLPPTPRRSEHHAPVRARLGPSARQPPRS